MSQFWAGYVHRFVLYAPRLAVAIGLLALFLLAAKLAEIVIRRLDSHAPGNHELLALLGRTAKIALVVFGVITACGTAGINVQALVAGLGLTGFALGFAFRDVLSNLLAGVLILLYRPFHHGDQISVSGLEGKVMTIDLRYTTLAAEGKEILIPNSNLFTNPIVVNRPPPASPGV
jgi:small conductance mechanosensitive channel